MMKLFVLCFVYLFLDVEGQRIAGGATVSISDYPFATALLTNGGDASNTFDPACGGTILTTNAILSAASCFYTGQVVNDVSWWRARVGSSSSVSGGSVYLINRITPHPQYVIATRVNDIAVLRTTLNITMDPNSVQPAKIAGAAYTFGTNQEIIAIGWGDVSSQTTGGSEQLRRVQIWTINQETCSNRYNAIGFTVTENMVCVGWLDVGIRGQCPGDAGSPILDSTNAVVGLFSWAEGCANSWYPDVNTRISAYTSWIVETAIA